METPWKSNKVLLGTLVDDLPFVAGRVSEIAGLQLYEMSSERYGDHYSAILPEMIERFGYFDKPNGSQLCPFINVIKQMNDRYAKYNFPQLRDYPIGLYMCNIQEMEELLKKILADEVLNFKQFEDFI